MSIFNNLTSDNLETPKDTLGGGVRILESGIYEATVKLAYAGEAASGAISVTTLFELADGTEFRNTQYVSSGRDKGGKNFYTSKDGKDIPLPGFTIINDLCILTTENPLSEQNTRERTIEIYDFEAKKNVPTAVQCIEFVEGEKVWLGIQKVIENKTKKNESTGDYDKINEEREFNDIAKLFHFDTKVTVAEALNGAESTFFESWGKKHTGVTRNKYEEQTSQGKPGAPRRQTAAPQQSSGDSKPKGALFKKK